MRLKSLAAPAVAFLVAAVACIFAAQAVVGLVEDRSTIAVAEALSEQGHDWAEVQSDGLQVVIEGTAPSEAARFRAISAAGGVVDASRVIDNMDVAERETLAPPDFVVEILRNEAGISLIGLIPAATDREALSARMSAIAGELPVSDFLEMGDYPRPETWGPAMDFAVEALSRLPQSKISVTASQVSVTAITDSRAEKSQLESLLAAAAPDGVRVALDISAPRPVVTPYTARFHIDSAGALRVDTCAAGTEEGQRAIVAAARAAGAPGRVNCPLALGAPTARWGEAVSLGVSALGELGGGSITFTDADVVLLAAEGTERALFEQVTGELENALPDVFALEATLPETPEGQPEGPPQFTATLSPEGQVQLRGRVPDELINTTAQNYAEARFGRETVTMGTRITEGLPPGWSVRVLAALDALSHLSNGSVVAEPDTMTIRGNTGDPDATAEISQLLIDKLGADAEFTLDVNYVEALDPIAALPTPEECIARIGFVTTDRKILFDPGSTTLTADTEAVLDDIAEVLRSCIDLPMEIAGYTDSQGREETNLRISQQRADAVLTALRNRRVPTSTFEAVGYGEENPIADNETEAGREANRRIEFSLITPEPVEDEATTLEEVAQEADDEASE